VRQRRPPRHITHPSSAWARAFTVCSEVKLASFCLVWSSRLPGVGGDGHGAPASLGAVFGQWLAACRGLRTALGGTLKGSEEEPEPVLAVLNSLSVGWKSFGSTAGNSTKGLKD